MAYVNTHTIFPTMLIEFMFDMDKNERDTVIKELDSIKKKPGEINIQTKGELDKRIPKFASMIGGISEKMCENLNYKYESMEMTGMWANKLVKGEVHPPHNHSNNILSGVYYLEGGSPIQFFDPRPQASVLHPNIKHSSFENSGMLQFDSDEGFGLMFPAWLQHWVPENKDYRISISWNILLRGDYGQPGTLQNSHI